jgi:hypothetical protein
MKQIRFADKICGGDFRELLVTSLELCTHAILVVRERSQLDESGSRFVAELSDFTEKVSKQDSWPGTQLLGDTAEVFNLRLSLALAEFLIHANSCVFDFLLPSFPEDLCLFRSDSSPWFVSISHEESALLCLSSEEEQKLRECQLPWMRLLQPH